MLKTKYESAFKNSLWQLFKSILISSEQKEMLHILIINSAEAHITEFAQNLEKIIVNEQVGCTIKNYQQCKNANFSKYDGILISGSPQGDDIVEHHQAYFQWIKTVKIPTLGICAGHHITAFMYGAQYLRSVEPESGKQYVDRLVDDPIFEGIEKKILTEQMHNDSVTLPENFIHLASSRVCFNQAMKHAEKPLYTFQFHPEYINQGLIQNFVKICAMQSI